MPEAARSTTEELELGNVEFIGNALRDPLNVLRAKLKDLGELTEDESVRVRRVIVITDYIGDEGRGLGIMYSENEHETEEDASDSVLAILTKLSASMALE